MTEWDQADRDIASVWHAEQQSRCKRCGTWEWQWDEEDWVADHYTCEGCRQLDMKERDVAASPGKHDGVKLGLFRNGV